MISQFVFIFIFLWGNSFPIIIKITEKRKQTNQSSPIECNSIKSNEKLGHEARTPVLCCTVDAYLNPFRSEYLAAFAAGPAASPSCSAASLTTAGSTASGLVNSVAAAGGTSCPSGASGPATAEIASIRLVMSRSGTRPSNRALDGRFFTPQLLTA
jgi:hypothetical protein